MRIRPATLADAGGIARVHVAAWQDNYRGLIADSIMEVRTIERRQALWLKVLSEAIALVFVADDCRTVAGFVSAIPLTPPMDGFDAYLQAIYLRSESKSQGIGRALVRAVAGALTAKGCSNLVLRTLRLGDARGFYERLGARLVPNGFALDAGTFDDVVYAFDELNRLIVD
ncbi:MAG TPA: GNAT family N-acetyltransferase [Candidatus Binatia bacterium]|nr:GNAT family N-acetyltransferase [Candidatus Binatia bacterium]